MAVNKTPLEHVEQVTFVAEFRKRWPAVRVFAIPNGGLRSKTEAIRLVAEGVSSGVPDLYIPAWRCWVEMKRVKGGIVSDEQEDWHVYLRSLGDVVIVARGWRDGIEQCLTLMEGKEKAP